jgi:hypothetical protein
VVWWFLCRKKEKEGNEKKKIIFSKCAHSKDTPFNHWKHKDLSQCASGKFVHFSVSQSMGHNAKLGHEAILNRSQNNFITITTLHYFNKYVNRRVILINSLVVKL